MTHLKPALSPCSSYRGGLDVRHNQTGETSYHTVFRDRYAYSPHKYAESNAEPFHYFSIPTNLALNTKLHLRSVFF